MSTEPLLIFQSLYAEIERLTGIIRSQRIAVDAESQHIEELKKLITELCDALEKWEAAKHWGWTQELFQRAREAIR